jgi:high-affinity iron transporter
MRFSLLAALAFALSFSLNFPALAAENDPTHSARFLVHLLDYLAKDYAGAVSENGKILSESEYSEQREFAENAVKTNEALSETASATDIKNQLTRLEKAIQQKQPPSVVTKLARATQQRVIEVSGLEIFPNKWPDLKIGKTLFKENCTSCHGDLGKGDGPAASSLNPKPANLTDRERMKEISPFNAFNTIRLGVPGTAMLAFQNLSDQDVWALAYFASAIRFQNAKAAVQIPTGWDTSSQDTLKSVSSLSDVSLIQVLPGDIQSKTETLAALRTFSKSEDQNGYLALAKTTLLEAKSDFKAGNLDSAKAKALKAYLEGIEPIEPRMRATDPEAVSILEGKMAAVRGAIESQKSQAEVDEAIEQASVEIDSAAKLIEHHDMSPVVAFFAAFAILLREGFEAVLIILALLGVIRAAGAKRAALWVHGGWISALACGGIAWIFSGWLMGMSGASREMLEGSTSIFAVVVLLYVGFWLHRQSEIGRWKEFLDVKVKGFLQGKNLFGLAAISFMAVFREAFETVLFLRSIWFDGGDATHISLGLGVLSSLILVITLSWIALTLSKRLPLRQLFTISSVLMLFLATILAGKGVHSLQETGLVGVTSVPLALRWELAGVFPTLQTLLAQIIVAALVMILWRSGRKPSTPATAS